MKENSSMQAGKDVEARVQSLGQWFHNIRLEGVQTAPDHFLGDYPAIKWQRFAHALPEDLRGCSVLDIGCNAGFYCLEMKRRGADLVVGIDTDERYLAQARLAAEITGLEIELEQASVYDVGRLGRRFDLVLFMGVFYHLRHPLLALDLIHEHVVKDLLVFQTMLRGSPHSSALKADYGFWETEIFAQEDFPTLFFVENSYAGDPTNWWIPNAACAEAVLRSAGFEIAARPESEVFICHRVESGARHLP